MKRVIITGVSGFIGQALASCLLGRGTEVWGVCAHPEKLGDLRRHPQLHLLHLDFQDYSILGQRIGQHGFDDFFHFAWQGYGTASDDCSVQTANITYAYEAACAAAACGCEKFIFADSSHEYLKSIDAQGNTGFCSVYGAAKRSARQMCQIAAHAGGMAFTGVLFANVFGVGDRSSRSTNTLLKRLLAGQHLDLTEGAELHDWTYIDDCIGGIIAAAEHGRAGQVYYVGSRQLRPFREIITEVRDILAPQAELRFGAYQERSFVDFSGIDLYALYRDTGYLPTAVFKESILKTADWIKQLSEAPLQGTL